MDEGTGQCGITDIDFYRIATELSSEPEVRTAEKWFTFSCKLLEAYNIPLEFEKDGIHLRKVIDTILSASQSRQEDKISDEWTDADTDHAITGN